MSDQTDDTLLFPEDGENTAKPDAAAIENTDAPQTPWEILVVDDDPEVFNITTLVLSEVSFKNRRLNLTHAKSAHEARDILKRNDDIAVILLDVVMETDDAGLNLVKTIRDELKNHQVRIILRTGQPGQAPERDIIVDYDINDYRAKTELTAQKLFSTTIAALRAYEDIMALERGRSGLEMILNATSSLFQEHALAKFCGGVLTQLNAMIGLSSSGLFCVKNEDGISIISGTGDYESLIDVPLQNCRQTEITETVQLCFEKQETLICDEGFLLYIQTPNEHAFCVYIDSTRALDDMERNLIEIFARKVAIGMDNLHLIKSLKGSHEATVVVLAALAEYKDTETGEHIVRVATSTENIARKLKEKGNYKKELPPGFLNRIGPASMLHDVGKVSIPDKILLKPGKLEQDERSVMETHAANGGAILQRGTDQVDDSSYLLLGAEIARTHHEHYDGNGYPAGLAGNDIPLSGRIVAVADVFDALVSKRPYKEPWPTEKAVAYIRDRAGQQFDPLIVDAFLEVLEEGGVRIP